MKSCMITRGRELDLLGGLRVRDLCAERLDLVGGDVGAVLGPQEVLQQHLEAVGQGLRALNGVDAEDLVVLAPRLKAIPSARTLWRYTIFRVSSSRSNKLPLTVCSYNKCLHLNEGNKYPPRIFLCLHCASPIVHLPANQIDRVDSRCR